MPRAAQESPETVPTGEMPRSIMLSVDRNLVDRATPGHRVTVTGIMSIMNQQSKGESKAAIRTPYLQAPAISPRSRRHLAESVPRVARGRRG